MTNTREEKADVVKSLSAKIPYSSPDHTLPCLLMQKPVRQQTLNTLRCLIIALERL